MAADKILDRIDKLIALATNNPNDEEARTAAMQAVKLIREHSCSIALPGSQPQPFTPPGFPPHPTYNPPPEYDAFRQQQWSQYQQFYQQVKRDTGL